MADSEVRQKFEAYMDTVPTIPDGVDSFDIFSAGFEAGMRAGEIAMREKAAKMAEAKFESAPSGTWPVYGAAPLSEAVTITVGGTPIADAIRAVPLSGDAE